MNLSFADTLYFKKENILEIILGLHRSYKYLQKEIQIFSYDIQKKKSTEKSIKDLFLSISSFKVSNFVVFFRFSIFSTFFLIIFSRIFSAIFNFH